MNVYRTRTYIAADFDNDEDAVNQLHKWNNSDYWSLSFTDAHGLQASRDTSLYCSIKASLKMRMDHSKTFILIVGRKTNSLTKGGCQMCSSYNSHNYSCAKQYSVDYRSYIDYECHIAKAAGIKIVVLYKSAIVNKTLCPKEVKDIGTHVAMCYRKDGCLYWDYNAVKTALED